MKQLVAEQGVHVLQPAAQARKEALWAALYCLAATALFFRGPLFFWGHFHIPHDLSQYHYPLSKLIAQSLLETGSFPWWNPYSFMGEPLYANVQAAMFYPPRLLMIVLSNLVRGQLSFWLMEVQLIAHVALAGLGTYTLLRLLRTTVGSALAGATVYQLGAFFASQTQHLGAVSAAGWLPWFLAALYRLEQRRDCFSTALSGVSLALMILAGHPPSYLPALVFGPFLFGFWMWQRHPHFAWRPHARAAVLFGLSLLLAAQLGAISWIPGYHLAKRAVATLRPQVATEGLPLEAATSFIWPNLFNQLRGEPWLSSQNPIFLHVYQGIPALLLVLGGWRWLVPLPRARPFLAAAVLALLWMFGRNFLISELVYFVFPRSVSAGFHAHYVLAYFSLFFAVLSGLALDGYERGERPSLFPWRFCVRAAAGAVSLSLLVCAAGIFFPSGSVVVRANAAGTTLLLVALSLGLCGLLLRGHVYADFPTRRRLALAFCFLVLLDLVIVGSNAHVNTASGYGQDEPPAVNFLRERLGPLPLHRMDSSEAAYTWGARLPLWRLPSANGFNPLMLRDTLVYREPFSRLGDRQFDLERPESALLDLAGIRYILSSREKMPGSHVIFQGEVNIFENLRAFPRFFLVGAVVGSGDMGDAVRMIHTREVDPGRVAVVPAAEVNRFPGLNNPAPSAELGEVLLLAYSPNEVVLRVRALRAAVLVANESYWPDWQATVDGARQELVRANGIFRCLRVSAGTHEVRMYIVPRRLYLGAAVSAGGLLLAGFCLLWPSLGRSENSSSRSATEAKT